MKIIVCIKQVPMSNNVKIDEQTGVLMRSFEETKLNPYDLYALEAALRLKERLLGSTITALTMGPAAARQALKEAIDMGVDEGVLLTDRAFAGSDVLATSYALSQAISLFEYDLIVCGKQTTDGDTAQVGGELSYFLSIPYASYVMQICGVSQKDIEVVSDLGGAYQRLLLPFPCLISVEKNIYTPRLPSYKIMREKGEGQIKVLTLKDLKESEESRYGLKGSPTQVERVFTPQSKDDKEVLQGKEGIEKLYEILQEKKFI